MSDFLKSESEPLKSLFKKKEERKVIEKSEKQSFPVAEAKTAAKTNWTIVLPKSPCHMVHRKQIGKREHGTDEGKWFILSRNPS